MIIIVEVASRLTIKEGLVLNVSLLVLNVTIYFLY